MNRRTFLKQSAGAAAVAALAERKPASALAPPIQHIVHVIMENRSFDHFLGWFPNATAKNAGLSYLDNNNVAHSTYALSGDRTGCGHPDPDHSYAGARVEYNNGAMDGWLRAGSNDVYAIGYYVEQDIPAFAAMARNFVVCDQYFASILGPTFPNRIFAHSGQTDRLDDSLSLCSLPTIWDRLSAAGVSHKYYYGNIPFLALYGLKYLGISAPFTTFLSDCAAGTLPAVSFLDPKFTILLNTADDDHPNSDIQNGDAFLWAVYHSIASSPNWNSTVLVVTFDEWGGFFDHVAPPRATAPNTVDPDLVNGKALLGCRVPAVVISPWTVGNPSNPAVNHTVFDHTSVLKMIESVFNVSPVAARETSTDVGNLLSVIDLTRPPMPAPSLRFTLPTIPQKICVSSVTSEISSPSSGGGTAFQRMIRQGLLRGWPVDLN